MNQGECSCVKNLERRGEKEKKRRALTMYDWN